MSVYDTNTTSVLPLPLDPPLQGKEPSEPSPLPLSSRKLPDWLHAHIHTPDDLTQELQSAVELDLATVSPLIQAAELNPEQLAVVIAPAESTQ